MLLLSAEDTRKCETTERISAGALGWHPSEYKKPNRLRLQWNDEALHDSDVIWRRCFWLIHQMTKHDCELRAPFCVSRFLSRARKEGCVSWSCQGMELYLILWHVVMSLIARGQTWLYQPSPVSTVPNTEELLLWRKTSYCRSCHELKCSAISFQFQMEPTFYQRQYHRRTMSPVQLCQCLSQ